MFTKKIIALFSFVVLLSFQETNSMWPRGHKKEYPTTEQPAANEKNPDKSEACKQQLQDCIEANAKMTKDCIKEKDEIIDAINAEHTNVVKAYDQKINHLEKALENHTLSITNLIDEKAKQDKELKKYFNQLKDAIQQLSQLEKQDLSKLSPQKITEIQELNAQINSAFLNHPLEAFRTMKKTLSEEEQSLFLSKYATVYNTLNPAPEETGIGSYFTKKNIIVASIIYMVGCGTPHILGYFFSYTTGNKNLN